MEAEAAVGGSVTPSPRGSGLAAAGWAVTAIVALLALVDVAVETFWSGSPVRWWVAPPVIAFVVLSAWLWKPGGLGAKRWGWEGAAAWSAGGFLFLLAVTAWLPEGQTNGVRLLLQPTATVLTLVTAAAVVLAGFVLFRALAPLPSMARTAARAVLMAVAVYALASLGLALYEGAPFAALFQGGAAWQRLPRWLQGTCVGTFALLPLALLGQFVRVIDRLRRRQSVRLLLHQATAMVMALVMAASGAIPPTLGETATLPVAPGGPPGAASSKPVTADPLTLEVIRTEWTGGQDPAKFADQVLARAAAELAKPGADPSDVKGMASALGNDTERIFTFLRDRIILEPYVGMLRGARGTLAAGAGNALDRALLAQALLKASGTESRLVTGRLAAERAQTLLNLYLAADPLRGPLASVAAAQDDATLETASQAAAARIGVQAEKAQTLVRRASSQAEAFWRAADEQRRIEMDFLGGQLLEAGVRPANDTGASQQGLRERLARHYWIQIQDGGGAWSEFDPSFPDAKVGAAYAVGAAPLDEIPRDLVHRFEISLVYHTTEPGAQGREVLLEGEAASADALFEPLAFRVQPAEPTPDAGTLAGMEPAQQIELLRSLKRFQGILQVGSVTTVGRAFDLDGKTYSENSNGASGGPSSSAVGDVFGGLFGGGAEEAEPGKFVDLQLVLTLRGPDRNPATQTRTLVRAGDVKAPGFAPPLLWSEILVQPQWIPADLVTYQTLHSLVAYRGLLTDAMAASREGRGLRVTSPPVPPFPQHLLPLALLRQRAAAAILRAQPGVRVLIDTPLLTMANQRLSSVDPDAGGIRFSRSIDIVANDVNVVGQAGTSNQGVFEVALRLGVADCTLESRFLRQIHPEDAASSGADVFERAKVEGRPVAVVSPRDSAALRRAGLGESDIEWIRENEAPAGRLVVTTTAAGSAGWWSVGPDGASILRVSGGWGQASSEHLMLNIVKGFGFAACGWEVRHAAHKPTSATGWGMASCLVLSTVSVTFLFVGVHGAAVYALLTVEIVNAIGTAIAGDNERVRVIDLR